jgi:hypothetical protein
MKQFVTSDLYLASTLKLYGFKLVDIKKDQRGHGVFSFEDRIDRPELVKKYFGGELTGSLKAFVSAWGDLRNLVNQMD